MDFQTLPLLYESYTNLCFDAKKQQQKILPIFLKFLVRHTSYFRRKAFYEDEYDKLNEPFSNIKPTFFPY